MNSDISIVGAGVIGAAIAWQAARRGHTVRIYDPLLADGVPQTGASWAAGGMLAPFSEGWPGEDQVLDVGAQSLARWPALAAELLADTGIDVLTGRGTLLVAADSADAAELDTQDRWLRAQGHAFQRLGRGEVRDAQPALAKNLRGGLWVEPELAVDNRALLRALRTAAAEAGAELIPHLVTDLPGQVVLAAGSDSAALRPGLPVRPVKGEILRLRRRPGTPEPPTCTIRALVRGRHVYLVPRPDGVVVGATMCEHGEDRQVTVAGVRDLLADAEAVLPSIAEYELADAMAGLRPMTPDNLPLVGRLSDTTIAATGHGRNGVLMMAITVDTVLAELGGNPLPQMKCLDPGRFSWN
ncbi:glycine oxidase ThiO [Tomitella biformata]|uniref:glycine oxidase ThiO n=1 Tax=Tomitella biformata TaxID=630403 RepID=UPI000685D468|nr:glycine oxidase ThiO [Tomitella biformata]